MSKPLYNIGQIVPIEFNSGNRMNVTIANRHYNVIYGEWVYFAKELNKNILESNIML